MHIKLNNTSRVDVNNKHSKTVNVRPVASSPSLVIRVHRSHRCRKNSGGFRHILPTIHIVPRIYMVSGSFTYDVLHHVTWPTSSRRLPQRPPEKGSGPPRLALSQCHVPRHHSATARLLWPMCARGTSCRHHFVELTLLTLSNANWKQFSIPRRFSFLVFKDVAYLLGLVELRRRTLDFLIWYDMICVDSITVNTVICSYYYVAKTTSSHIKTSHHFKQLFRVPLRSLLSNWKHFSPLTSYITLIIDIQGGWKK